MENLGKTFTELTGKSARFNDALLEEFADLAWQWQPGGKNVKIGRHTAPNDDTLMTSGDNFTALFKCSQATGSNLDLLMRDYNLLNELSPGRINNVGERTRKVRYIGKV